MDCIFNNYFPVNIIYDGSKPKSVYLFQILNSSHVFLNLKNNDFFQHYTAIKGVKVIGTDRLLLLDFEDKHYHELFDNEFGNWEERENNSNIEQDLLTTFLSKKYDDIIIKKDFTR